MLLLCKNYSIQGQVINITYKQDKVTSLYYNTKEKIGVFLFYRDTDSSIYESNSLLNRITKLQNGYSDYNIDTFLIYIIRTIPTPKIDGVCVPFGKLKINNHNINHADFTLNPYYILVDTSNKNFQVLLKAHGLKYKYFYRNSSPDFPFVRLAKIEFLPELVTNYNYNFKTTHLKIKYLEDSISSLNQNLIQLSNKYNYHIYQDSLRLSRNYWLLNVFVNNSLTALNSRINPYAVISKTKITNYSISISKYNFSKINKLGLGIELNLAAGNLNYNNPYKSVELVNPHAIDPNGEIYKRIAYCTPLSENLIFRSINFLPRLEYKLYFNEYAKRNFMRFYTGIGLNCFLLAKYSSRSGEITYGGIYPQFKSTDTTLNGIGDLGKTQTIYNGTQNLRTNTLNTYFNSGFDVFLKLSPSNPYYLFFGLSVSQYNWRTDIEMEKKKTSPSNDKYNSQLYKSNSLKMNVLNLNLGFCINII